MVTRKTTYGIRALAGIARAAPRLLSVAELAKREGIPEKFLSVILLDLGQRGIVHGKRGRVGGYELAVDPDELTLADVVEILSGPVFPIVCLRAEPGRASRCQECPGKQRCAAEIALRRANSEVRRVLSSLSLSDLVEQTGPGLEEPDSRPRAAERGQRGGRLR